MIVIENSEALEVLTDAAAATTEPCWSVGLVAATGSVYTQSSSETGATTGTTAVVMVAGVASTQKRIMGLTVYNRDSASRTITIRHSTTNIRIKALLVSGGSLQYSGDGWAVHDANGVKQYIGTPGAAGVNGSDGALTVREAEIDFGVIPVYEKTITVTAADVVTTSEIIAVQSGRAATGRDADENECDFLLLNCRPGTGQFTLNAQALPGPVTGKYKINYQFS